MMNEWIISSSLLIAAVLGGRWLLRGKISLRLQYALWAVVLIRLLLPFQLFTSDFGAGSIAQDMDISEPVRQVYASAREDDYERAYDAAYSQVVAEYLSTSQSFDPVAVEREAAAQAEAAIELNLKKLLYGAWFAGMVVMTSVIASCNVHLGLHLKRRRWELPVSDSLLPVYITEAVPTPCIFGLFHPAIYLTPEAAGDESVRSHVLAHELTHYRHWDHIWSVLRSLCLILHWYNPLVWMAAKVSRADAELACDEGALAKLGESHRADYGRTLIGLTCPDHGGSMFVTATTMTGSAGSIQERIKLLMKRPRNTVLALTAMILIGAIIVGCTFAGAPDTTDSVETTPMEIPGLDEMQLVRNGELVYPETYWNMTPEQLKEALDVSEEDILYETKGSYDTTVDGAYMYHDLEIMDSIWGYPVEVFFSFEGYTLDGTPGLEKINVHLGNIDMESFKQELSDILGEGKMNQFGTTWSSGSTTIDLTNLVLDYDGVMLVFRSDLVQAIQTGAVKQETTAPAETTDPTDHTPEQDMSYQGQELPIPEEPTASDFLTDDGLLIFPGTRWGMTEAELLAALDIREYALLSGPRGFLLADTTFCGYPARVTFYFNRYRVEDEWGLCNVTVQLEDEDAANGMYNLLYEQLGRFDFQANGVAYSTWWSDAVLEELVSPDAYAAYQTTLEFPSEKEPASSIAWYGSGPPANPETSVIFRSSLPLVRQIEDSLAPDQTAAARADFTEPSTSKP